MLFICGCFYFEAEARNRHNSSLRVLPLGESLLIPIGRSFTNQNKIKIWINDGIARYEKIYDGHGGYWAKVSTAELPEYSMVKVRYFRHQETTQTYRHKSETAAAWINPSFYIDSDNKTIQKKARELYVKTHTIEENVKAISNFITKHVVFKRGFHRAPLSLKASQTLLQSEGVCINFARLFIALSRASGIAARSVSGIVLSPENPNEYDFHHEWAEYMDEFGVWHPLDLTYSQTINLSDIRYSDFVYAAEDHPYFSEATNKNLAAGRPFPLENNDIVLFHYHPIFRGAKYGFKLIENNYPEFFVIEKAISIVKKGNKILIQQNQESSIISNKIPENLEALIELNTDIKTISEPEYSKKKAVKIPNWLDKYDGKMFIYRHKFFKTIKIKFEVNYNKNAIFLTEFDDKEKPNRYQLGLTERYHLLNETRPGLPMGTKAKFKKNMVVVDIAVPELGWRAKGTYSFSGDSVDLKVIDSNGNEYYTNGSIVN